MNETLALSLSGLLGFNNFDSAIYVNMKYKMTDQIGIIAGTNIFLLGIEEDTFGKFKNLSSIYMKAEYRW